MRAGRTPRLKTIGIIMYLMSARKRVLSEIDRMYDSAHVA